MATVDGDWTTLGRVDAEWIDPRTAVVVWLAANRERGEIRYRTVTRAGELGDVRVLGSADTLNQSLEKAGRVADFFELAELMARDALEREESCGGHFRSEHQTDEGEAQRDDENFAHVAAWEWHSEGTAQTRHREELAFEDVALSQRSYK